MFYKFNKEQPKERDEQYEMYMRLATNYKEKYHFQKRNGYMFADVYRMWFNDIVNKAKVAGYNLDISLD